MEWLIARLDGVNRVIYRAVAWLSLALALLGGAIVFLRYGFSWGSIALQELLVYLHALILLCAAAWTLADDGHVRVDIFYGRWSVRRRALVDLAGNLLFVLPFAVFLIVASWSYVGDAWVRRESSAEPGGLPAVFLLKSLIMVFAGQLILQGLLQAYRAWGLWRGED